MSYTQETAFFGRTDVQTLLAHYGSPLYVYNEAILRERCRRMVNLVGYPDFHASYSVKANTNLTILRIARQEGMHADAMSCGEIRALEAAGYTAREICFIPNNVSRAELQYAIDRSIVVSVDSLSQLERVGELTPGTGVAVRFNPGVGAGHNAKVITGGKGTKFGIDVELADQVAQALRRHRLRLVGITQHIGSLFMEGDKYLQGARNLLSIARRFPGLEFIDFGGGFGVPYRKLSGQAELDLQALGRGLDELMYSFARSFGPVEFRTEPGRYVVAECGVLLGRVEALKESSAVRYAGTDIGLNVLMRPVLYDSHHDIELYRDGLPVQGPKSPVTVVGNICETGDILARCELPRIEEGDALCVLDAGAYGFSMASNYNLRLRPAEVLIGLDGQPKLIRRRETMEDLLSTMEV